MKTRKSFRILLLTALACMVALFGLVAVACEKEPEEKVPAGPEGGEYYFDANGEEYLITLSDGNEFTFKVAGEERSGQYSLAGTVLTLTFGDDSTSVSATLKDYNSLSITYKDVAYTFLRKTMYTVHFDTDGAGTIADSSVLNGKSVEKPADPVKGGDYLFVGWYTNKSYTEKYTFGSAVTGDITLYARFVSSIPENPEFKVSFVPGEGVDPIDPVDTLQGKVYKLPEPTKSGDTFVGWWVSMSRSSEELSYQYNEQRLYENTTFYAVWESDLDGAPAVSVTEEGITWTGSGSNISLVITPPSGPAVNRTLDANSFEFGSAGYTPTVEGKYTVSVTEGDKTTTVYYVHKALARVSVFTWEGNILQFNPVANATSYTVEIDCGTGKHTESAVDADGKAVPYFDFGECEMKPEGITFVVTAAAEGYVSSTSDPYVVERTLAKAGEVTVDDKTQTASWEAVENATSYLLTVVAGEETVFSSEVTDCTYSLKTLDPATVKFTVVPKAHGWNSPDATESTYQKTKLAVPTEFALSGTTLTWKQVNGAKSYTVTVNGTQHPATSNSFELTDDYHVEGGATEITVVACAEDKENDSPASDVYRVTSGEMGSVSYSKGVLSWDSVFGVTEYVVKVNENGVEQDVTGTSFTPVLTAKENTLYVRIKGESEWKTVSVKAYEISFDLGYDNPAPAPLYKATGDPIELTDAERYGYEFAGWYSANAEYNFKTFDGEADLTLTAHWTPHKHTINFDTAGGSESELQPLEVDYGSTSNVAPVPVPSETGYAFEGWYTMRNGEGVKYFDYQGNAVQPYNRDDDLTLYARFVSLLLFEAESNGTYRVKKNPEFIDLVEEVTVPATYRGQNVTVISDFSNSLKLRKLNIPATITTVNLGETALAFAGCTRLTAVTVYEVPELKATPRYYDVEGVLFSQNVETGGARTLVYYPEGLLHDTAKDTYTVPDDVEEIGIGAFYSHSSSYTSLSLRTLNIPASVARISAKAFHDIYKLENINFLPAQEGKAEAASLVIAEDAFEGTTASSVTKLTLPRRFTSFDPELLMDFRGLTSIDVEDDNDTYTTLNGDGNLYRKLEGNRLELVFFPRGKTDTVYTIPNQVDSVGKSAFQNYTRLTELTVPGNVTNIAESAFEVCVNLVTIHFLGTETDPSLTIGERAFYAFKDQPSPSVDLFNNSMTELVLPANLKAMGNMAFAHFTKLTHVTVNAAGDDRAEIDYAAGAFIDSTVVNGSYVEVVDIGKDVPSFSVPSVFGSKLREVHVAQGSNTFKSDEQGVLYNAEMTELLFFPAEFEGTYEIPEDITSIGDSMFANATGLEAINIHKDVIYIGKEAFSGCSGLATVTIEAGGTALNIGDQAFRNCTALREIELPNHLKSIGKQAFYGCKALTHITIPASVESISLGRTNDKADAQTDVFAVFESCSNLSSIEVAEGSHYYDAVDGVLYSLRAVKKNGAEEYVPDTLLYCPASVTGEIHVPDSVRRVAMSAFGDAEKVETITFADLVETENADPENPDTNELTLGKYAFGHDTSQNGTLALVKVHLPNGLKKLEDTLFNYSNLREINIPKTVTSIEYHTFSYTTKLETITFDEGGTEGLRIEDGDQGEGGSSGAPYYYGAFGNTNITEITFPARLTYLGSFSFYYDPGGTSSSRGIRYPITTVTFTASDTFELEIGVNAFYNTHLLKSITFAEGLTKIDQRAFYQSGITSVTFPKSLKTIDHTAFAYCNSLETVNFAENGELTEIADGSSSGNGAFYRTAVQTVALPASLEKLGAYAFSECTKLTTVTLPDDNHLETFGENVFNGCTSLSGFTFGKSADDVELTFGANAFAKSMLTQFSFPANTVEIGDNAFSGSKLTTVTFDVDPETKVSKLTKIGSGVFQNTALQSVTFPETTGDLVLGANMFKGCKNLTNIYLSKSVSTISGTFNGCGSIKTITIAEGNPYFSADGKQPIIYDSEGRSVMLIYADVTGVFTIAEGAKEIAQSAFANQTSITEVHIPASVTSIGAFAFENCINLQKIEISPNGSALTFLGKAAFHNCRSLTSVNLEVCPWLATIESHYTLATNGSVTAPAATVAGLFTGCTSLETVKFPAGLKFDIIYNNFNNWSGTTGDYLFKGSPVKNYDFSLCTELTYLGKCAFEQSAVETVILPKGLENLGVSAFDGCANLSRVTADASKMSSLEEGTVDLSGLAAMLYMYDRPNEALPDSFNLSSSTSSNYTFRGCASIKKVILPPNVQYIGGYYFQNCTQLAEIEGLENVTGLCSTYIFANTALTSVTIGKNVVFVGSQVFKDCKLLSEVKFEKPELIETFGAETFMNCTSLTSFDFSKFTKMLGSETPFKRSSNSYTGLFRGSGVTSIDLSVFTKMTTLPNYFFADCASLTEVKLPAKINCLGTYAFQNCTSLKKINSDTEGTFDLSALTELKLIGTNATTASTSGAAYTFDGCTGVQKVILPENCAKLAGWVFQNCTNLTDINLDKVTQIGNYCFSNTGFRRLVLNKTVTSFGEGAFMNCAKLEELVLRGFAAISGKWLFAECPRLQSVVVPTTLTHLGTYTFQNDVMLSRIIANDSTDDAALSVAIMMTSVGTYDFSQCKNYKYISSSATSTITSYSNDSSLFLGCLGLKKFIAPANLTQVGGGAFDGCANLTEFDFTNITNIGKYAFRNTGLKSVNLGSKLTVNVFYSPFDGCKDLAEVTLADGNSAVKLENGSLIDVKNNKVLASLPNVVLNDEANGTVTLPENIKTLADYAFYGMHGVKKVDLSHTQIAKIPQYAFYGSSVEEVVLPDGVTEIGNYAFANSGLKTMNYPTSLTKLGGNVFSGSAVENMTIPKTVTSIGAGLFYLCEHLQSVTFEDGDESSAALTITGGNSGVPKDTSQSENRGVFEHSSVQSVTLGNRITEIPIRMFAYTKMTSFPIPETVTYIKRGTFFGAAITSIEIPATVVKLDQEAFQNSKLQSVTFAEGPDPITTSAYNLFQGCADLTKVDLGNRFTTIAYSFFEDCTALETLVIPEGVVEVNGAFKNCTSLSSLTLPSTLEKLLDTRNMFENTPKLKKIVIPEGVVQINKSVFASMTKDQKVCFIGSPFVTAQLCGVDWMLNSDATFEFNYSEDASESAPAEPQEAALEAPVSKKFGA